MNSFLHEQTRTATLNLPALTTGGEKRSIPCLLEQVEGKRLKIACQERPAASAVVSVEYDDALFLGEVMQTRQCGDAGWQTEIKIEQVLTGLQSLMSLRAHLLGEGVGPAVRTARERVCV